MSEDSDSTVQICKTNALQGMRVREGICGAILSGIPSFSSGQWRGAAQMCKECRRNAVRFVPPHSTIHREERKELRESPSICFAHVLNLSRNPKFDGEPRSKLQCPSSSASSGQGRSKASSGAFLADGPTLPAAEISTSTVIGWHRKTPGQACCALRHILSHL